MSEIQLLAGAGFEIARVAGVRNRNGVQRGQYVIREARNGGEVRLSAEQWAQLATWLNPRGVQL